MKFAEYNTAATTAVAARPTTTSVIASSRFPRLKRAQLFARKHRSSITIAVALVFLVAFMLSGVLFPLPFSPTKPDVEAIGLAPSATHFFGTDGFGFDVYSRVLDAGGRDIPIALAGALVALALGVPVGIAASGGKLGDILMRGLDGFSALPILILVIVAIRLMGGSAFDIVVAIAIVNTPRFARLVRAEAVALRSKRFVEAAVAAGASPLRIAVQHIVRNAYGIVLVQTTLAAANAIGVIAALNFLGVGTTPPTPTWGGMIRDGMTLLIDGRWWASAFPTVAIFLVVVAFNAIADGIEARAEATGGHS
ncbi:ABC transporter permease [Microbacterium sp. ASV81]|uniref:ABC transporter permease n=2 Tax=Microbacterium capsulatum TaxID=3041921 RepID=A0ABU0XHN3_9MICO|nr:ABC transporter permease [Microbacterium sp. ASV81]